MTGQKYEKETDMKRGEIMRKALLASLALLIIIAASGCADQQAAQQAQQHSDKVFTREELRDMRTDHDILDDAVASAREEYCNDVKTHALRVECFDKVYAAKAVAQNEAAFCNFIQDSQRQVKCRESLVEKSARRDLVPDACLSITDERARTSCVDDTYFNLAQVEGNPAHCDKILTPGIADLCRQNV